MGSCLTAPSGGAKSSGTVVRLFNALLLPARVVTTAMEGVEEWLAADVAPLLIARTDSPIQPSVRIARPLLSHVELVLDDPPLRRMFAQLLASAMDPGTAGLVHPSFATVLAQLNADEARFSLH